MPHNPHPEPDALNKKERTRRRLMDAPLRTLLASNRAYNQSFVDRGNHGVSLPVQL